MLGIGGHFKLLLVRASDAMQPTQTLDAIQPSGNALREQLASNLLWATNATAALMATTRRISSSLRGDVTLPVHQLRPPTPTAERRGVDVETDRSWRTSAAGLGPLRLLREERRRFFGVASRH
jgi:hypothetical protein